MLLSNTTFLAQDKHLVDMKPVFTITFLLFVLFINNLNGQTPVPIFLQMEKYGSTKVKKIAIGSEVTFLLHGEDEYWRTEFIENLIPEKNIIVFTNGMVNVEDIAAFRKFTIGKWAKGFAYNMYTFGASWGIYTVIGSIFTDEAELSWRTAIIVATSFVVGFIVQKTIQHRTYRFGKKRRLRILDMRIEPLINP